MSSSKRGGRIAGLVLGILALVFPAYSQSTEPQANNATQKRVLVLHLMGRNDTSSLIRDITYQQAFSDGLSGQLDYYSEYVDLARFGGEDYQSALRDFLKERYKGTDLNVVIASTPDLRNFLIRYGAELFPHTPVVFSSDDMIDGSAIPPNFTGIVYDTNLRGTLDNIRRLQPGVRRVFVVTGASNAVDKWHEARAREQFKDYGPQLEFTYWSGLPLHELKRRVSNLTSDAVVYFLIMAEDGDGQRFASTRALDQIAAVSSVPIYTWFDGFLGHGVVGGKLASSQRVALRTAELALRILRGESVETIPITKMDTSRLAFDWRELQRWKLDENRLAPDAEVLFREDTFWNRYKNRVLGLIALLALQSALIVALLFERRRRRKATSRLTESEECYRNVVESQTELICRFLSDTTLTFVNDAYCEYFEKTAPQLVGTKFIFLIPEADRGPLLHCIESLATNPRRETWEHPVIRPDGSPGWQQWTNCVISFGPEGKIELQGVGRDISERKQLEEKLIRSERQFSTLVENSPDVISRLDRNLRYVYVNPSLKRISGISSEAFIGKRPCEVDGTDYDWRGFESSCRQAIDNKQTTIHEFQYRGRQYCTRIIPENSSGGEVESVMSISEDITERIRVELELRLLTARLFNLQDEERRRIARELHDGTSQNIFAITLNLRRLDAAMNRTPEVTKVMNDIQQLAVQSLTELRTLSYLLHPPILDHAGLGQALQWFVRGFSERSGIRIAVVLQDIGRLPPDIETALFRVVQESLTNIRRHSGSETATIRLEKRSSEILLQISDSGHGMIEATGAELVSDAVLGVGIPGMRQRLIQLGGRLEIESTTNGTTITAVVPAIHTPAAIQVSSESTAALDLVG